MPDTTEWPEWANWKGTDADGNTWFFKDEPTPNKPEFGYVIQSYYSSCNAVIGIEKRPEAQILTAPATPAERGRE